MSANAEVHLEESPDLAEAAGVEPGRAHSLEAALDEACSRIPPLWTLRNFVAVNPYLGLLDRPFRAAADEVARVFHADHFMPVGFYRGRHAEGRIREADLEVALAEAPAALGRPDLSESPAPPLRRALFGSDATAPTQTERVLTLAERLDREQGSDWAGLVCDEIAKWCAGRFDAGQAAWPQPGRDLPLFAAWRQAARIDRSPEVRGLRGFRAYVRRLPEKPVDAIAEILDQMAVPVDQRADLLSRELASIAGWAGHVQLRVREAAFEGHHDPALVHLLAVRLAFDGALHHAVGGPGWPDPKPVRRDEDVTDAEPERSLGEADASLIWQLAFEAGYRRDLLAKLSANAARPRTTSARRRRSLQAVFCIDVRSERLRRHLESLSGSIQTFGFAGFFGFPIQTVANSEDRGEARCPVLIQPSHRVLRTAPPGSDASRRMRRGQNRHRIFGKLRKLAVGAFPLAETAGQYFGLRLITDALTWTQPHPGGALFPTPGADALRPRLEETPEADAGLGIPPADQVDLAEGALRNLGLTEDFAEVVLLCGHGSHSANNPYASSLDCGACGGHPGDESARIAAEVLNNAAVRAGLAERGISIPEDTRFVAGFHETTCDQITLLDAEALPEDQRRRVEDWLETAGERTAEERSQRLGGGPVDAVRRRARDWAEVRPEWGLAGNAAFVAAPRSRTRGLDLGGRVFLHDYDRNQDPDGSVLTLVLTAPLVVASWINLQYYASTVDNEVLGSGSKVLHNVVGRHSVMTGNRSDLRVGLPWQSVHDGVDYVHEPMRLTAVIDAPRNRIDEVVAEHADLRVLIENDWLRLLAWDPEQGGFARRMRDGTWRDEALEERG